MKLEPNSFYHVFNRGNNKRRIFFNESNYLSFIDKMKIHLCPVADVIAYCLMPNHFHLVLKTPFYVPDPGLNTLKSPFKISHAFKIILSSHAKRINNQEGFTGSLFQQNTKAKVLHDWTNNFDYLEMCVHYLHNNPVKAGLVTSPVHWPYSSYLEYNGLSTSKLVNIDLAKTCIEFNQGNFLVDQTRATNYSWHEL